jgi:hypothetical protein
MLPNAISRRPIGIALDDLDAIMREAHTGDSLDDFLSGSKPEKTPTGGDGEEVQRTPSEPSVGDDNPMRLRKRR